MNAKIQEIFQKIEEILSEEEWTTLLEAVFTGYQEDGEESFEKDLQDLEEDEPPFEQAVLGKRARTDSAGRSQWSTSVHDESDQDQE